MNKITLQGNYNLDKEIRRSITVHKNREFIEFGNTGLRLEYNSFKGEWSIHFTPDNHIYKVEGREEEFKNRFVLGIELLVQLLGFIIVHDDIDPFDIPGIVTCVTNERMFNYLSYILNSLRPGIVTLIDSRVCSNMDGREEEEFHFELDLAELVDSFLSFEGIDLSIPFWKRLGKAKSWIQEM